MHCQIIDTESEVFGVNYLTLSAAKGNNFFFVCVCLILNKMDILCADEPQRFYDSFSKKLRGSKSV